MNEDPEMCEALKELMKDEFEKTESRGIAIGEIRGAIKLYHEEMNLPPAAIVGRIMVRFDLKQDAAEKYVEETLVKGSDPFTLGYQGSPRAHHAGHRGQHQSLHGRRSRQCGE